MAKLKTVFINATEIVYKNSFRYEIEPCGFLCLHLNYIIVNLNNTDNIFSHKVFYKNMYNLYRIQSIKI